MLLGLARLEVSAFKELCRAGGGGEPQLEQSVSGLAEALKTSKGRASRVLATLERKGFITFKRLGRKKVARISAAKHATALKELLAANPHVAFEEILANSGVRVLTGMLSGPVSLADVARFTLAPEVTVRRTVSKLLERGVVRRLKPASYVTALPGLKEFVDAYAAFAAGKCCSGFLGSLIVVGPVGLVRANGMPPKEFRPTGMSVFHEHGVAVVQTSYRDYVFHLFGSLKKPSGELAAVHALVRARMLSSTRELSYVLLVAAGKRFNRRRFLEYGRDYGVLAEAKACLDFISAVRQGKNAADYRVEGLVFPGAEEFLELEKQYG